MKTRIRTRTYHIEHTPDAIFGTVRGPEDAVPLLRAIFRDACDADREHFVVLALNARNEIIGYKIVGAGSLNFALIHPREIFVPALAFRSAAVLIAHSHPSQHVEPSSDDEALTERLIEAGNILGIPVIDHIIVASSGASDAAWRSVMPERSRHISRFGGG